MDGMGRGLFIYCRKRNYLFTVENVIITYLSIVLDIVLGDSSFKITLRILVLY